MKHKKITPKQIYLVSIDVNEDIVAALTKFVKENMIQSGYLFGIGAVKSVRLGHYNVKTKKYSERKIKKLLEIASLNGIITSDKLHLHGVFSNVQAKSYAGHVARAVVSAACEIVVVETEEEVVRTRSEEVGLDLLDL